MRRLFRYLRSLFIYKIYVPAYSKETINFDDTDIWESLLYSKKKCKPVYDYCILAIIRNQEKRARLKGIEESYESYGQSLEKLQIKVETYREIISLPEKAIKINNKKKLTKKLNLFKY